MDLLSASVKTQRAGSETYVIVELSGEADATSSEQLREVLDGEIRKQPRAMVIDLSGLRFLDSTALHVILRANRELGRHGCVLALAAPREPVAKVLRLTATDQLIPVYPSTSEATAGLAGPAVGYADLQWCLRRRHGPRQSWRACWRGPRVCEASVTEPPGTALMTACRSRRPQ